MTRRDAGLVGAVSVGVFLWILDAMVVTIALGDVGRDLGASAAGLQWVVDAYAIVFASLLVAAGLVADRIGARRVYGAGLAAFMIASLACAAAPGTAWLAAARVVQGAAGAALLPSSLSLLRQAFPDPARRARAIGIWSALSGAAGVAGPLVGGVLVAAGGWRLAFLMNVPLCALGLLLSGLMLPETPPSAARRVDARGQGLLIAALSGAIVVLIETPHRGLDHPVVLAGFAIGAGAAARLRARRSRGGSGLLPAGFFARRTVAATALVALLHNFGGWGALFVLTLYLQLDRGWTALETGLAFLPMPAMMAALSLVSGRLVRPLGARALMAGGTAVGGLAIAGLAFVGSQTAYAPIAACLAGIGGGTGLAVPAMTAVMLAAVPPEHAGASGAVLSTARQLGTALGVATIGALAAGMPDLATGLALSMAAAAAALVAACAVTFACVRRLSPRPPGGPAT